MKKSSNLKIVSAAMIGHVLEFFDFTIYAVFASTLGKLFFPNSSELAQTLSSLAVFAVGFFMRPIGGALFGHIGDRMGRRTALTISVIGMALATLLMAALPTYEMIGIAAPILLVMLRLVQGLCVGGEGAGASIFVLEHLNKMKPGLVGGIVNSALTIGILMALMTGLTLNKFFAGNDQIWRYAFLIGGIMGMAGLYLRLSVEETPVFEEMKQQNKIVELPLKEVFQRNLKGVVLSIIVGGLTGCSGYFVMTFIKVYYESVLKVGSEMALSNAIFGNVLLIVFLPLAGMASDKIGFARTIFFGCIAAVFSSVMIFEMMSSGSEFMNYLGIALLATVVSFIYAPLYPYMLKLFTPEQRYSGIACCLNIGIAAFGGTSSMICVALVEKTGSFAAPAYYWNFLCVMFIAAELIRNKKRISAIFRGSSVTAR